MQRHELYPGQVVTHQGEIAKVLKINPVKIKVEHESGVVWTTHHTFLEPAPAGTRFESQAGDAPEVTLGTIVRYKSGSRQRVADPMTYVVCAISGSGIRMALLGGDHGRYRYNVQANTLEVIHLDELLGS